MTDEEIDALVKRLWVYGTDDSVAALAAIRWLRDQRDEAFAEGQRDMQFAAAKMTNDPDIFAKIYDLQILTRPLKRS